MLYPTYASYKAIESSDTDDDTQWLMYWVVFAIFTVLETVSDVILFWIPYYWQLKLVFFIALQLPQYKLASQIYTQLIKPVLDKNASKIDKLADNPLEKAKEFADKAKEFTKKKAN
uniref:Receptor expression-enhancing protein n=1 Tax=Arcella intermedia TaxID=1963864 RepID=A0A6B2LR61_9EUKA